MKKSIGLILITIIIACSACKKNRITGEGAIITEDRNLSNFSGVASGGNTKVYIQQGNAFKVQVKDYGNLLPYFDTKVNGSMLEIGFRNNTHIQNSRTEVFITMPSLTALRTAGSGDIAVSGIFSPVNVFDCAIAGSGNISIENATVNNAFTSNISGSGDIHAFGITAAEAAITTYGSGNTEITATNKLTVQIAGSGNVYYKGNPVVNLSIAGSGKVIRQ